ncbi:arabinogalactan protein 23-like [Malania oleifera]|uniref:arabinogalactan protein 23-like n=1 Tax=Malania oleifera TaxID=397392 RepID=UPI0025AE702F|nr:arabinogalactan protein 23-like [Malania oleifera]
MEMKKVSCAVLFAAAAMSAVVASAQDSAAPAPGPASSSAAAALPAVGASILSLLAYYLH